MHPELARLQGCPPLCQGRALDRQSASGLLGTASAVGDCHGQARPLLSHSLGGTSHAPVGMDPQLEELSGARWLPATLACLSAELGTQRLELGPWRGLGGRAGGGDVREKGEKSSMNGPEVPP